MKKANLAKMVNGWFIGDFEPSVLKSKDFEVAVKKYKSGDIESTHYHKLGTEITVVVEGKVTMCNSTIQAGEILVIEPNEVNTFEAIEDSILVVIKTPSIIGDKFLI